MLVVASLHINNTSILNPQRTLHQHTTKHSRASARSLISQWEDGGTHPDCLVICWLHLWCMLSILVLLVCMSETYEFIILVILSCMSETYHSIILVIYTRMSETYHSIILVIYTRMSETYTNILPELCISPRYPKYTPEPPSPKRGRSAHLGVGRSAHLGRYGVSVSH